MISDDLSQLVNMLAVGGLGGRDVFCFAWVVPK